MAKEKTKVITSQKSFSGSGSQTLFSAEPSDSRKYVCVRRLDIITKANIPIIETVGNAVTTPEGSNLLAQSKSGTPKCEKVPQSPGVRPTQTNILSLTHEVIIPTTGDGTYPPAVSSAQSGYSVTGMANDGSTVFLMLSDFYNPESPLFHVPDDFIHEIVTGNIKSSVSSINSPSSSV